MFPLPSSRSVAAVFAFVAVVAAALAQSPSWTQRAVTAPPARSSSPAAYDVFRGVTTVFGGNAGSTTPLGDTWEWNGSQWSPRIALVRPSARWGHGLVFDGKRGKVVLFGGFDGTSVRNDTWEWDGAVWQQRSIANPPPARAFHGMAYDSARGVTVVFGGEGAGNVSLADTWEYNGVAWTLRPMANAPSPRRAPAFAWDEERRVMALFGGSSGTQALSDTWEYDGAIWAVRPAATAPAARWLAALACDGNCGRLILFGGASQTLATSYADTWTWDGLQWTQLGVGQPPARHGAALLHDAQRRQFVLLGGRDASATLADQWELGASCGRVMVQATPLVVGQTAQLRYDYPTAAANHFYWHLFSPRQSGAFAVPVPGFATIGLARVDLLNVVAELTGFLDASGQNAVLLPVPNQPSLVGFQFDMQSADLDFSTLSVRWAENDIEATVAQPAPVAAFTATPTTGLAPLVVAFTNASQFATSYLWDFGDGTSSTAAVPAPRTYTLPGQFIVTLTATGPGGVDVASAPIVVTTPQAPVASFTATPLQGPAPLFATFTDTSANGPTSWQWDFNDDGVTDASGPTAAWTFQTVGAHPVRLTVANAIGSASATAFVVVLAAPNGVWIDSFVTSAFRDPLTSGDQWTGGAVVASPLGSDGRHGSFRPEFGTDLGGGVFEWNLDQVGGIVIPASSTQTGQAFAVTDGRFFFSDFVLPEGQTVRFRGSVPPQLRVRGRVEVRGTIDLSGVDMPATVPTTGALAGQRASTFNARGTNAVVSGQLGGLGGAGGGRGGNGANECNGLGPQIVGGVNLTNGQPGQSVRVPAFHAFAGQAGGTGGSGSLLNPATGLSTTIAVGPYIAAGALTFHDEFSRGGGGGGYILAGGTPALPTIPPPAITQPNSGPATAGGVAFPLLPFPAGLPNYQSLDHFLVGGSGGGGGGSHSFGIISVLTDDFMAGHGGSGGGGAIALRAGGDLLLASSGQILVRGGRGVVINGDNPATSTADVDFGVSSPGGGGSGGSILLQSGRNLTVQGLLDASGGAGSRVSNVSVFSIAPTQISVVAQAGAGSNGFFRLEAAGALTFNGPLNTVPTYSPATNSGALTDRDSSSGSRSVWLPVAATTPPVWLRYELDVDPDGAGPLPPVTFTDSGAFGSTPADDPSGPVVARFQVVRRDLVNGAILPSSLGPWRTALRAGANSVNLDNGTDVRFELLMNKASFPTATITEIRLFWQ